MGLGKTHPRHWNAGLKPVTMKLASVRLLVDDFAVCHRFYSEVLGLTPRYGKADGVYEEFDGGAVVVALFDRGLLTEAADLSAESDAGPSPVILAFAVKDVDRTATMLRARGVEFVTQPTDQRQWSLRVALFRDPAGNLIEISAPLKNRGK